MLGGLFRKSGLGRPLKAQAVVQGGPAYSGADTRETTEIASWFPGRSAPDAELQRDRGTITARARDMVRNNGWVAGAMPGEADAVVGGVFRPSPRLDRVALGLSRDQARDAAQQIEAAWSDWADDPRLTADASRTETVGGLIRLAYLNHLIEGDAIGVLHWRPDRRWSTTLRVVDPDLLCNPMDAPDDERLRGGVELDDDGAATAYHFRRAHPRTAWPTAEPFTWDRIEREHAWGRPQVVHFFERMRDGQTRGVSRLVSVLEKLKAEDKYGRTELQAAMLNAILGVYITSPLDHTAIADMLSDTTEGSDNAFALYSDSRANWHNNKALSLNGVRLPTLYPGEQISTVSAARPSSQFAAFETAVLRNVAAGLRTTYERLAADWSQTNYSSARAAMVEIWRGWSQARTSFASRFCGPVYMAFLEEAFDRGRIRVPGAPAFWDAPSAWARARWIGPGRGFVDPVKEAQASGLRISLGLSSLRDEAAELTGTDWRDTLEQTEREIEDWRTAGLLHPALERRANLLGGEAIEADIKEQEGRNVA
jgi:lambda family phage portal protein